MDKVEILAGYAHDSWSRWMKNIFKCAVGNVDGSITIDKSYCERWIRQMNTAYNRLSDQEKDSDRTEARKIMELIQ